jgi:hypothetical protein
VDGRLHVGEAGHDDGLKPMWSGPWPGCRHRWRRELEIQQEGVPLGVGERGECRLSRAADRDLVSLFLRKRATVRA